MWSTHGGEIRHLPRILGSCYTKVRRAKLGNLIKGSLKGKQSRNLVDSGTIWRSNVSKKGLRGRAVQGPCMNVISWEGATSEGGGCPQAGLACRAPNSWIFCLDFIASWHFSDDILASNICWYQEGDSPGTREKSLHGKGMFLYIKKITFWTIRQYHMNLTNVSPSLWAWAGQDNRWTTPEPRRPPRRTCSNAAGFARNTSLTGE